MSDRTRSRYAYLILLIVVVGGVECADRLFDRASRVLQSVNDPPKLVEEACKDYSIDPKSLYPNNEEAKNITTGLKDSYRFAEDKWSDEILVGNYFSFGSGATGQAAVVIAIILLIIAVVSCLTIGVYTFFSPRKDKVLIDSHQKDLHEKQKKDKYQDNESPNPESRNSEKGKTPENAEEDEEEEEEEEAEKKTVEDKAEDKDALRKKLKGGNDKKPLKKGDSDEEEGDEEWESEDESKDPKGKKPESVKGAIPEAPSKPRTGVESEKTTTPGTPNPEAKTKERVNYRRPEITKLMFILAILLGIAAVAMCIQCIVVATSVIDGRPKAACTIADTLNQASSKNGLQLTYTTFLRIDQAYTNLEKNYQHVRDVHNWQAYRELEANVLQFDDTAGPNVLYPNPKTEILKPMWDVMMPLAKNSTYALRDSYYNANAAYTAMWNNRTTYDYISERAKPIHTNLGVFLKDYSELRSSVPVTTYIFRDGSFSFILADSLFLFFLIPILVFMVRICFRAKGVTENPRRWFDFAGVACLSCWAIYAGIMAIVFCLLAIQAVRSCNQLTDVLTSKSPDKYLDSMPKESTRFVCKHCLFSTRDNFLTAFNQSLRDKVSNNFLSYAMSPISQDTRFLNETFKDFMTFARKPYPDNMAKDIKFDILTMVQYPIIICQFPAVNGVTPPEELIYQPKVKFCDGPEDRSDECTNTDRIDPADLLTFCKPSGNRKWDPTTGYSQIINGMVSFNDSVSDYDAWMAKYQTGLRKSYADNIGDSMIIPMENSQTIKGFSDVTDCRMMFNNLKRLEMRVCRDVVAPFKSYAHNFLGFVAFLVAFTIFYILQYLLSLDYSKGGVPKAEVEKPLQSERAPIKSAAKEEEDDGERSGAFKVDDEFINRDSVNRKPTVFVKPEPTEPKEPKTEIKPSIKKSVPAKQESEEEGEEEWEDEEGEEEEGEVESLEVNSKSSSMGMPGVPGEKRVKTLADKGNATPGSRQSVGSEMSNKIPNERNPINARPKSVSEKDEDLYSKSRTNEMALPQAGRVNNVRDGSNREGTVSNGGSNRSSTSGFDMPAIGTVNNQPNEEDGRKSFASISDDNMRIPRSNVPGNLNK